MLEKGTGYMPKEELEFLIRALLKKNYFGEDSNNLCLKEMYHRQNVLEFQVRNFLCLFESLGFIEQLQPMDNLDDCFQKIVKKLGAYENITKSTLAKK